jgi:hypothetical protein
VLEGLATETGLVAGFELVDLSVLAGSTTLGLESFASVEGLGRDAESVVFGGAEAVVFGVVEALIETVDTLSSFGEAALAEAATLFAAAMLVDESAFATLVVGESTFATVGRGQR